MNWLRKSFLKVTREDSAFSLVEVLVSLFIISLLCGALYFAFSTSTKSIFKARKSSADNYNWYINDEKIRNIITSVNIPYWARDFDFSATGNVISLNYVSGNSDTKEYLLSDSVDIVSFQILTTSASKPFGIYLKFKIDDFEYELKEVFSSLPDGLYGI